jgi:hypothetical protein
MGCSISITPQIQLYSKPLHFSTRVQFCPLAVRINGMRTLRKSYFVDFLGQQKDGEGAALRFNHSGARQNPGVVSMLTRI